MEHHTNLADSAKVYRLAWVAYVFTICIFLIFVPFAAGIAGLLCDVFAGLLLIGGFVYLIYRLAFLRSFQLYCVTVHSTTRLTGL